MKKPNNLNVVTKSISFGIAPFLLLVGCILNGELFTIKDGRTLLLTILSRLILAAIVLIPFFQFKPHVPWPLLFMGDVVAIGFSWCPTTYLYVYLSYLFMTIGILLLYFGITREKMYWIPIAGVLFGANIFNRIMNFTEVAFILVIWYDSILNKDKKWIKRSLLLLGGFLGGIFVGTGAFILFQGMDNVRGTLEGLLHLFTKERLFSEVQFFFKMLMDVFRVYFEHIKWFLGLIALIGFGNILFMVKKEKAIWIKRLVFVAMVVLFMIWYSYNGVFTTEYTTVDCVFPLAVVFIMLSICIYICMLVIPGVKREERLLGLVALVILLIAPLGSSNHLFTCMNQLYLVAPITIVGGCRLSGLATKQNVHEPLIFTGIALLGVLMVQAILFRCFFIFDGSISL
ncbi:MAG: hypothetical protein MJ105_00595 [Lachnospiraceae bacterium]|nr:hypothetical protein [Lachnospiraceae bacterium]